MPGDLAHADPATTVEPTPDADPGGRRPRPRRQPTDPAATDPAPTATPAGGVGGATGTPNVTLPPTDVALAEGGASSLDGWRVILLAMAGVLAAGLLLTPASAVVRSKDDRQG